MSVRGTAIRSLAGGASQAQEATHLEREDIASLLTGYWLHNEAGRCFVAEQEYGPGHVHGLEPLAKFGSLHLSSLSKLCNDRALEGADVSSALFLDIETTGLDRNSGALGFLVGVGCFREGRFRILQFFADSPGSERAMLLVLSEFVRDFGLLVTFNGKAFDIPMLQTRMAVCDLPDVLGCLLHADMLYPARRLWKSRLGSCRLGVLEQLILGLRRTGDVPGRLIPALYLRYCRERDCRPLLPVFYHNAQDLLTLVALTTHGVSMYTDPFHGRVEWALDFMSLGRAYEAAGDDRAVLAYDRALSLPLHGADRAEVCKRLTPLLKRSARLGHAVTLWEEMVKSGQTQGVYAFIQLAKYYEHEQRQFARAEELLLQALSLLPGDCCTHTTRRELEKSLNRVRGKIRDE